MFVVVIVIVVTKNDEAVRGVVKAHAPLSAKKLQDP